MRLLASLRLSRNATCLELNASAPSCVMSASVSTLGLCCCAGAAEKLRAREGEAGESVRRLRKSRRVSMMAMLCVAVEMRTCCLLVGGKQGVKGDVVAARSAEGLRLRQTKETRTRDGVQCKCFEEGCVRWLQVHSTSAFGHNPRLAVRRSTGIAIAGLGTSGCLLVPPPSGAFPANSPRLVTYNRWRTSPDTVGFTRQYSLLYRGHIYGRSLPRVRHAVVHPTYATYSKMPWQAQQLP